MAQTLKILELTLIALAGMNLVGATWVQAEEFEAEPFLPLATITGEQIVGKHEFKTAAGTLKCNTATFHGSLINSSSQLTLSPTYGGCTVAGLAATVNANGCDFTFTAGETVAEDEIKVGTDIECPSGKTIEVAITGLICKIKIPVQEVAAGITAKTTTAAEPAMDVDMMASTTGQHYILENGSKCPNAPASGEYADGTFNGTTTIEAEDPETLEALGLKVA